MKQNLTSGVENICHLTGVCVCASLHGHMYSIFIIIMWFNTDVRRCFNVKSWNQFTMRAHLILVSLDTQPEKKPKNNVLICYEIGSCSNETEKDTHLTVYISILLVRWWPIRLNVLPKLISICVFNGTQSKPKTI